MSWERYDIKNQIEIFALYSLFEAHLPNNWNFAGESHDFWECVYVIKGDIFASGDGRVYNLSQGEIIFHEPMEFHRLWIDNQNGADILIFSFSAKGELLDLLRDKVLWLSANERKIISELLDFMRSAHIGKKLDNLQMELRYLAPLASKDGYLQSVSSYINLLFLSLCGSKNTAKAENTEDAKIFYDAVRFMSDNIASKISVNELASLSKTSTSTLMRIFEKYTGVSIHRYFIKLKINRATELLQSGKNVTEVAEMLGFCSQAHFSKAYKNMTGKNPSSIFGLSTSP